MSFLLFTKYNSVYPPLGCTHHTPYFIYTPIKLASFENHQFCLKNSNLALHGIYVLCKIKYPIASGALCPPDPLLQRYNFRISSSPQQILDPPLIYDQNFWQEIATRPGLKWTRAEPAIFTTCFLTTAKMSAEPWCKYCHSVDHTSDMCGEVPRKVPQPQMSIVAQICRNLIR